MRGDGNIKIGFPTKSHIKISSVRYLNGCPPLILSVHPLKIRWMQFEEPRPKPRDFGGSKEQIVNRVPPPSLSTGNWSQHVIRVISNHGSFPHLKHTCFTGLLTPKTDMTMEKNNHLKSFEDVFPI